MNAKHLLALAFAGACGLASAQHMKPGLWEITNKMQTGTGQMEGQMAQAQQQMANLPPEQRKMMEQMMAQRGVGMSPGGGMTMKVCMTKEMVERNEMPSGQRGDCKHSHQQTSANTMKIAFTCTNPPSSGEGEVSFSGNESYTMKMAVNTQVQGRPERVNMNASGRWLGADCGSIQPMMRPGR